MRTIADRWMSEPPGPDAGNLPPAMIASPGAGEGQTCAARQKGWLLARMTGNKPSVLLVEDARALAETYRAYLAPQDLEVHVVTTGAEAMEHVAAHAPGVVVLDVNLPDGNGLDVLKRIKARGAPCEVVLITGKASVNIAVEAMREGAFDFVMKPFTADRLRVTVRNALDRLQLASRLEELGGEIGADGFEGMIGRSPAMQAVYRLIGSAAPTSATVFISGESGTGKELCAHAIHALSKRAAGPLVSINCAAIPRGMQESEIFGHARGAFTGAVSERKGAMLSADGGTLFLDEVCEMDPDLQTRMLRVLQEKAVRRVGEDHMRPVDVRIVCATNRDPEAEVAAGRFREDLYYRLHVMPVELPPLRARGGDAVLIARHFLRQFAEEDGKRFRDFTADCERALAACAWPGNIRQLQNAIRRAVVLNDGELMEAGMLPAQPQGQADIPPPVPVPAVSPAGVGVTGIPADAQAGNGAAMRGEAGPDIRPLDTVIREAIESAISLCGGNIPRAAQALKVSPSTLYRRLQSWNGQGRAPAGGRGDAPPDEGPFSER
ncbi:sigma-54-dependent transcriptional regulator [Stappia sp.]|uniref:sigma-54-dependent transcriptional regulator n=1 Tax=Stappia sp. TaxID=1870903 RepID=UPI003D0BE300